MKNKKGQASTVGSIIALVIGVGVSVLVLIFVGTFSANTYLLVEDDIAAVGLDTPVTESITVVNGTFTSLAKAPIDTGLTVSNSSGLVGIGNFTVDTTGGAISLNTTDAAVIGSVNNSLVNVSYTYDNYTIQSSITNGITSGFEGLEQTGFYLPLIVLAVVIALVLSLVLGMGYMRTNGGNMGAL